MPKSVDRINGFDWLRVLALGLVLVFHISGLFDLETGRQIAGMSLGGLGVTLFLGISGALIGKDQRPAGDWIFARLKKIYPAYWIATILAFLATAISGYKPVSFVQFLWQMSGMGLFYAEDLINVATWFIGLLLALYLSVFLARLTPYTDRILQILAMGAAILIGLNSSADYFSNSLAFYGAILAFRTSKPTLWLLSLSVPCVILSGLQFEFLQIAIVWVLLSVCLPIRKRSVFIQWISQYSYEFYLVDGIFLVGGMKLLKAQGFGIRSGIAMLIGVIATTIAAIAIQKLSQFILKKIENHGGAYLRTSPAVGTEVPKISTDVSVSRERSQ